MPLSLPSTSTRLTRANFADVVKSFVDGLESTLSTVSSTASAALAAAQAAYTKPAGGIPLSDLATALQATINTPQGVQTRRYVSSAWQPRGTTSTAVTVLWIKPTSTDPDPPIDATYFLSGTDVLLKA